MTGRNYVLQRAAVVASLSAQASCACANREASRGMIAAAATTSSRFAPRVRFQGRHAVPPLEVQLASAFSETRTLVKLATASAARTWRGFASAAAAITHSPEDERPQASRRRQNRAEQRPRKNAAVAHLEESANSESESVPDASQAAGSETPSPAGADKQQQQQKTPAAPEATAEGKRQKQQARKLEATSARSKKQVESLQSKSVPGGAAGASVSGAPVSKEGEDSFKKGAAVESSPLSPEAPRDAATQAGSNASEARPLGRVSVYDSFCAMSEATAEPSLKEALGRFVEAAREQSRRTGALAWSTFQGWPPRSRIRVGDEHSKFGPLGREVFLFNRQLAGGVLEPCLAISCDKRCVLLLNEAEFKALVSLLPWIKQELAETKKLL
ncbi:uncharacterized protein LOC34618993 [Cyclospora cayetanensis]|uniref:Uncharacterized protein LOC34618993 n=2 Tax=Cyclospora cayetanensis TaxID=88456 RepID=A0A6P5WD10_9EIME|nr:uncharacterized protein LOC34618993 [Cyclospora cayetanensis]OEH75613.1 hypothetical protein cyc_02095 [Cyclospora cayetanensis]